MGNEKKIYKSFDDWAQEYDMEEMNGIGSGCSYNFLLGMKPAWDARQVEIDKLKKELAEKNEVLGFYADRENWGNLYDEVPQSSWIKIDDIERGLKEVLGHVIDYRCGGKRGFGEMEEE